jgi:hypothetical protein
VRESTFLTAPYVHRNNDPKYHAMLLRAVEDAKHGQEKPRHILWIMARDSPENNKDLIRSEESKRRQRERFLQFHDQKTAGVLGIHRFSKACALVLLRESLEVRTLKEIPSSFSNTHRVESTHGISTP